MGAGGLGPGALGALGTPGTPGAFGAPGTPGTWGTLGPAGSSAPQALQALAGAGLLAPHFGHFFPASALGGLKHMTSLLSTMRTSKMSSALLHVRVVRSRISSHGLAVDIGGKAVVTG